MAPINAGSKTASFDYDPFGNIRTNSGSGSNYLFKGEQLDPESNLYFLRARYYDSSTGRFITRDPVSGLNSMPQTQNPYSYSLNNPINLSDPSGKAIPAVIYLYLASIGASPDTNSDLFFLSQDWNNCDWGSVALDVVSLALPGISVGAIKVVDKAVDAAKGLNIVFKTEHGMRHFGGTNLTSDVIESAIKSDILSKGGAGGVGETVERLINVQGTDIIYRANMWKDGVVNVGTYFLKP